MERGKEQNIHKAHEKRNICILMSVFLAMLVYLIFL